MQININISDDGQITTQVEKGPAQSGIVATTEHAPAASSGLDAGASAFSGAEVAHESQNLSTETVEQFDGGAGPPALG